MGSMADTSAPPLIEDVTESRVEVATAANGATTSSELQSPAAQAPTKEKTCGVCHEMEGKYKCPLCFLPYCSVACSKIHKPTHPLEPQLPSKPKATVPIVDSTVPRPGTVAAAGFKGPFAALDNSKELQTLFIKYPRLISQLTKINTATLPHTGEENSSALQGMQKKGGKKEQWNSDRGMQRGLEALRKARDDGDGDGEGVREFSKLILQILSGDEARNTEVLIQKEMQEENARIIKNMLDQEMG
ncbi:hypothetical protein HYALB_00001389 [Hymenoscyphus albidus]|uniref:HIT-type domain-containing protein n=1 Tax=Hymenoscyphus albidus TaxID=595503 RepID=A0A9N9L9U4_9HELO|nr:hypothetical protein HYALB_00001389 [Hymenoscyphus albidus]